MIINNNVQALSSLYASTQPTAVRHAQRATAPSPVQDKFEVSSEAQSFSSLLKELQNMSDMRADKVAAVEQQIEAGSYDVSSSNVAAKLLSLRY